jgi:hypothetical protein
VGAAAEGAAQLSLRASAAVVRPSNTQKNYHTTRVSKKLCVDSYSSLSSHRVLNTRIIVLNAPRYTLAASQQ